LADPLCITFERAIHNQVRLGQGRENAKAFLKENPDLFEEVHAKVMEARGISAAAVEEEPLPADGDEQA